MKKRISLGIISSLLHYSKKHTISSSWDQIDTMTDPTHIPTDVENNLSDKTSEIITPHKEEQSSEFTPAACLVMLGTFSAMFCSVGFINAFGVFQEFYQQGMLSTKSPSDISWLGSFNIFIMFAGTLPVGIVQDRFGPRVCLLNYF
jgi:hypothetical protein